MSGTTRPGTTAPDTTHAAGGLTGRRALVTGAASGIGLAIARRLASDGAVVVLADLPGEPLERAHAETEASEMLAADLSRRDEATGLAGGAGPVQILVCSAGLQHVSPLEEFPESAWDRVLAVMLTAPFRASCSTSATARSRRCSRATRRRASCSPRTLSRTGRSRCR